MADVRYLGAAYEFDRAYAAYDIDPPPPPPPPPVDTRTTGSASEIDVAFGFRQNFVHTVGTAYETDVAMGFRPVDEILLGTAVELNIALMTETPDPPGPDLPDPDGPDRPDPPGPGAPVKRSFGQINLVVYRYTPVSVNVGYEHGSVETHEYLRGTGAWGQHVTRAGVPIPTNDPRRP